MAGSGRFGRTIASAPAAREGRAARPWSKARAGLEDAPEVSHAVAARACPARPAVPAPDVLAAFTVACAVLIVTPGPDMALFLSKTVAQGRLAGLVTLAGALSGILVHSALAALRPLGAARGLGHRVRRAEVRGRRLSAVAGVAGAAPPRRARARCRSIRPAELSPALCHRAWRQPAQSQGHPVLRDLPAAVRGGRRSAGGRPAGLPRRLLHRAGGAVLLADGAGGRPHRRHRCAPRRR